ncbi:MAG: 5-bromo-4-chloroindolyl phosphate hydrolysis family protein [Butyrivibrio sp.]|nr:5-bromo-4-chloroindolyl phosphate hydrolysis family protein [Butyrivibrio sp.]
MNMKDICDAGSDILGAVADAVETGDYRNLNTTIRSRVSDVSVGISRDVSDGAAKMADKADELGRQYGQHTEQSMKFSSVQFGKTKFNRVQFSNNGQNVASSGEFSTAVPQNTQPVSYFARRRISKLNSIGMIIAGILGLMFITMPLSVPVIILPFSVNEIIIAAATGGAAAFVISGVGFSLLLRKGILLKRLIERYYRYADLVGSSEFFTIKDLAQNAGRKESAVRKDLKKMMERKMINARMDDSQTTVMLTDQAYEQYMSAENSRREREALAQKKQEELDQAALSDDVKAILQDGNAYLKEVRTLNDLIPDTDEMSTKLYQLENIMNRIFDRVRKEPQNAQNLRKFMTYYLPTTLKLLNAYVDLDKQPAAGENILQTKKEIEGTMDTINDAFEKLLDSLFQDVAWDISSDISVMKTMMAQDGLTEQKK